MVLTADNHSSFKPMSFRRNEGSTPEREPAKQLQSEHTGKNIVGLTRMKNQVKNLEVKSLVKKLEI